MLAIKVQPIFNLVRHCHPPTFTLALLGTCLGPSNIGSHKGGPGVESVPAWWAYWVPNRAGLCGYWDTRFMCLHLSHLEKFIMW